ncbi:MAG: Eco57I restriction-modification methylase domain-containing protein [Fimbriimonadaceae bacterium]|nr:Eco57I restriction-modification methylase domain-containing protein [Fimbriimonadaceae bacterium]
MARRANTQAVLPFSPVRNSELFANHWLERRLQTEPEWAEYRDRARACLDALASLWSDKREILTPDLGEHTLEDEWVHPVLTALGWPFVYQTFIQRRRPDYALFLSEDRKRSALRVGKQNPDFWSHAAVVADAKAWNTRLDRPVLVEGEREFPPEQVEWYMNHSETEWGLLTNGAIWRLIPRTRKRSQPRFDTYLELDLPRLVDAWNRADTPRATARDKVLDEFMPWYLLATPIAFSQIDGRTPLIERAVHGSSEYRIGVGKALRSQVFEALSICIEGFLSHAPNALNPDSDLELCRSSAFTLLFRLLFVLFCEDRQLLPHNKHPAYTRTLSLSRQHHDLSGQAVSATSTAVWEDWQGLFGAINLGRLSYGVPAYNGGLFDQDSHPFLQRCKLTDKYAQAILDQLRTAPEDPEETDGERVRVDYRDLAIQHLGNVYEGLLELHPRFATEQMAEIRGRVDGKVIEKVIPSTADLPVGFERTGRIYNSRQVYLETDKGERRASGSYYTPDHIVEYIVEHTLGPLCKDLNDQLVSEIRSAEESRRTLRGQRRADMDSDIAELRRSFDDRVLSLTVLDPSMGSGHFLIRACQYLAEQIATNPYAEDPDGPNESRSNDASTLLFWKRRVVERCIYGVDKNPIAVELAKLALWLETVSTDQPLSFLDHHLRHGDSLIGARIEQLGRLYDAHAPGTGEGLFQTSLRERLPILLGHFEDIRAIPSQTIAQVKEKESLYRRTLEPVREPFRQIAHLWTSTFFAPERSETVTTRQYAQSLSLVGQPNRFRQLLQTDWFATAVKIATAPGIDAFHWELEFPEVFLSPLRMRANRSGFDAIIGNPPYDVLAEREIGRNLRNFQSFIAASSVYLASQGGKNNLYKLFVCRALDLLATSGRLGFIVPMAFLGDAQAAALRKAVRILAFGVIARLAGQGTGQDVAPGGYALSSGAPGLLDGTRKLDTCPLLIRLRRICPPPSVTGEGASGALTYQPNAVPARRDLRLQASGDSALAGEPPVAPE